MIGIVAIYADDSDHRVVLGHTRELADEALPRGTASYCPKPLYRLVIQPKPKQLPWVTSSSSSGDRRS